MKSEKQLDRLRQAITTGKLRQGEMVGTEFGFSQEWGVARSTVRRGIDILVREGLLERQAGKGLFVRSVKSPSSSRTIQVVVPNLAWNMHIKIARGAQLAAHEHGVQTLVYDAHGQMDRDLEALRRLPDSGVDGAIIISLHNPRFSEVLYELKMKGFPFVLIGEKLRDLVVPSIGEDNYAGGYTVGEKLAAAGHRRIVFLGPLDLPVVAERLNGFRDAILDACGQFDRSLVLNLRADSLADWLNDQVSVTEDALLPILTQSSPPTAVFDGSADVVPFIYRAARRAKLRVPKDLSVVAFDDSPFTQFIEPEVSRLRHPMLDYGRKALDMLIEQMNGDTITSRKSSKRNEEYVSLEPEWVAGQSLAAPRKEREGKKTG